jgi:putative transferase (TIGR04331 family)
MNDFFKIWTAKKVVRGVPLCIFQHGNNFFTKRHHVFPEIDYCDRFVAWGSKHTPKAVSGFVLKREIKKSKKYEEFGKLLILSSYARSNISASENLGLNFFQIRDEKNFLKSLKTDLMDHVVFRIPDFNLRFTQTLETWNNFFSEHKTKVLIETSAQDFGKSLMRSRIAVFAYYSTGFLECIAAERPAICFWQNELNDFADYVIKDFKQMERVGLIHFTPESAAKHVNKHWDDVLSWWNNPEVKCVRQDFAEKYARYSSQPVKDLKKLLT